MPSGYDVNGIDLDNIFAPYASGTKPPATGYDVGGVDLNQRYDPISQGSAAQATGYKIAGGADLNTLFAAISTTTVTVTTQPANVSGSAAAGDPSGTVTSGTTTCAGSGGTGSYSYTWVMASGSATFTNPNSATSGVTRAVNANTTVTGTMYCTISDGVSSVNTNTVSWSLQNTTIPVSVATQPSSVSGAAAAGDPSGTVTSGTTSCVAANGTGSYSYAWHQASGATISFTNPTSATTAVSGTVNADTTETGTMYCTITDSTGGSVNTNTVGWSLQNTTLLLSVGTQPGNVSGASAAGYPAGTVTSGTTTCAGANGTGSYTYAWHQASGATISFTDATSATTAVSGSVNANTTETGTMYCAISDGVSTANTNTVSWSLQNTSPATWSFGITAAQRVVGSDSWTGYETNLGSGTNLTSPDGHTLNSLVDTTQTDGVDGATFSISGFTSDPGQGYFGSLTANGNTQNASAATYSYSSGVATWVWNLSGSTANMFGFVSGDTYPCVMTY